MKLAIVSLALCAVIQAAPLAQHGRVGGVIERVHAVYQSRNSAKLARRFEDPVGGLIGELEPESESDKTVPTVRRNENPAEGLIQKLEDSDVAQSHSPTRRDDDPVGSIMEKIESSLGSENTAPPALRRRMEEYEQHDPLLDEILAAVEEILSGDEPSDVKLQMILDTILHHGEHKRSFVERADTPDTSEITGSLAPTESEVDQKELETSADAPTHTIGQRDTADTSKITNSLSPTENEVDQKELETSADAPTHTIGQRDTPDTSELTNTLSPTESEVDQKELETSADAPTHTIGQRSEMDPLAPVLEEIKEILGKDESSQKKIKDILAEISKKPEEKRGEDPVESTIMKLDDEIMPETAELPQQSEKRSEDPVEATTNELVQDTPETGDLPQANES